MISIFKTSILSKFIFIYIVNAVTIKIPPYFFVELDKLFYSSSDNY